MSRANAEAECLLEDLGLADVPVIPENVCKAMSSEHYLVTIKEESMNSEEFHGISVGNSKGAAILINSNIPNKHRKRFTAAHEIGHVHLHIQTNKKSEFRCTEKDISTGSGSNDHFEKEANEFASSLLMPEKIVSTMVQRNDLAWSLVGEIQELCDVSLEAAARRVIALSKESCCLIIHKRGEMWTPVKSSVFNAFVPVQPFPEYLYFTGTGIGGNRSLPDKMDECSFLDWSFQEKFSTGNLFYSSIHNSKYDRTMTLLLHDEEAIDCEQPEELRF